MGRLEGKVAIITGAARGQGECEARLFVSEGARVLLCDVLDAEGAKVAEDLGDAAAYVHLDVSLEDEWLAAIDAAEQLGPLNVLINNAGIARFNAIVDTTLEEYMQVVAVNQAGAFLGIRSAIEPMKRAGGGSIVNVSSIDGLQAKNGQAAYASTKWALRGLTRVAALELGQFGIRANTLHPGGINTIMGNPAGRPDDEVDSYYTEYAITRVGRPQEMAQLALFLASDESSYSTGSEFVADGGMFAGRRSRALPGY